MDEEEYRRYLEHCLDLEQEAQESEVTAFKSLLKKFEADMERIVELSTQIKIGFARQAKAVLDGSSEEIRENRRRINTKLQLAFVRIGGLLLLLYLIFSAVAAIKNGIDNHFCQYFNVEGRTRNYETQKPCKR